MRTSICVVTLIAFGLLAAAPAGAADALKPGEVKKLLAPQKDGGKPLMQALALRQSQRKFAPRQLPAQTLSNLLWAAFGVNRSDSGKRTAPSAYNAQEIDIYVAMADGLWRYSAAEHAIERVLAEDIRGDISRHRFAKDVPARLIYVADFSRMKRSPAEKNVYYSTLGAGFVIQNVYLFAASDGLATVVLDMSAADKLKLKAKMGLRAEQHVILTQPERPVGEEFLGVGIGGTREGLSDHGDTRATNFFDDIRTKGMPGVFIV